MKHKHKWDKKISVPKTGARSSGRKCSCGAILWSTGYVLPPGSLSRTILDSVKHVNQ